MDAATHTETDDQGDDLVAEVRRLLGPLPPGVVERANEAREAG